MWRFAGSAVLLLALGFFTAWMIEKFSRRFAHEPDVALAGVSLVDAE